jgi:hypothetical protein
MRAKNPMGESEAEQVQSFCDVAGCKGASTTSRWITIGSGEKRRVAVCWKHAEGDLDPSMVTREDS